MKILVCGLTENPGGMESCVLNYVDRLQGEKIQFDFLSYFESLPNQDKFSKRGCHFFSITPPNKGFFKYKKNLKKFFLSYGKKYDFIWFNTCSLSNIDFLKYARLVGIKNRIIHAHNSQGTKSWLKNLLHIFNRKNLKKSANIFWSCSKTASDYFFTKDVQNDKNYMIVRNAIPYSKFSFNQESRTKIRNSFGIMNETVYLHIGRFQDQKNHKFLIRIFHELNTNNSNSKLLLVGEGPLKKDIEKYVRDNDLRDSVFFLGLRSDIPDLLSAADIFLFPSLFEGLSLALVEAQASGITCFVSDTISEESHLTQNYYSISLNCSSQCWAAEIISKYQDSINRLDIGKQILKKGFDIKEESIKLQKVMEDIYNGQNIRSCA